MSCRSSDRLRADLAEDSRITSSENNSATASNNDIKHVAREETDWREVFVGKSSEDWGEGASDEASLDWGEVVIDRSESNNTTRASPVRSPVRLPSKLDPSESSTLATSGTTATTGVSISEDNGGGSTISQSSSLNPAASTSNMPGSYTIPENAYLEDSINDTRGGDDVSASSSISIPDERMISKLVADAASTSEVVPESDDFKMSTEQSNVTSQQNVDPAPFDDRNDDSMGLTVASPDELAADEAICTTTAAVDGSVNTRGLSLQRINDQPSAASEGSMGNVDDMDDMSVATAGTGISSSSDRLQARLRAETSARSGAHSEESYSTTTGAATQPGATAVAPPALDRQISTPDERLQAKLREESTAVPGVSTTQPGAAAVAPPALDRQISTPDERLQAKLRGESSTTPGVSTTQPGAAAVAPSPLDRQISTPDERLQAKLREESAAVPGVSTTQPGAAAVAPPALDRQISTTDERLQAKLRGDSSTTPGVSTTQPGAAAVAPSPLDRQISTPDERLQDKLRGESSTTPGVSTTQPGATAVAPPALDRQISAPDERLQAKLREESAAVPGVSTTQPGAAAVAPPALDTQISTTDERLQAKLRGESSTTPGVGSCTGADPASLKSGLDTSSATMTPDERLRNKLLSNPDQHRAGAAAAIVASCDEHFEDVESMLPSVLEDRDLHSGAPESDHEKKPVKLACGLSRRKFIFVGLALLVVIVIAIGAAAGAGTSSSPMASRGGNEGAPAAQAAPQATPTQAEVLPPPTKPIPTECQLSRLPEENNSYYVGDRFGTSVAVSGNTAVVGASSAKEFGSVHIYERGDDGEWVKSSTVLTPSEGDRFGRSVDIHGDTIVVGAVWQDREHLRGCVYVYVKGIDGDWFEEAKLFSESQFERNLLFANGATYGRSIAIYKDTVIIGEPLGEVVQSGAVYVFQREKILNGTIVKWSQEAKIVPDDASAKDNFGSDVDVHDGMAVVGSRKDDDSGKNSGSAYVFSRDDRGGWQQEAKLLPADGSGLDGFGRSVAITRGAIVVGADGDDDKGYSSGSAYVFINRENSNGQWQQWTQVTKLVPGDGQKYDSFGRSVGIDGDFIVVGAKGVDGDAGENTGAAYVYERITFSDWTQMRKLAPTEGSRDEDHFGSSIGIDGATVAVGALDNSDETFYDSGSAHVIELC